VRSTRSPPLRSVRSPPAREALNILRRDRCRRARCALAGFLLTAHGMGTRLRSTTSSPWWVASLLGCVFAWPSWTTGCSSPVDDVWGQEYGETAGPGTSVADAGPTVKGTGGKGDAWGPGGAYDAAMNQGGAAGSYPATGGASGQAGAAGSPPATGGAPGQAGTSAGGATPAKPVDCSAIDAHPDFELCGSGVDYCDGVFTNGNGCVAFCAAAGLACASRHGGEPGCAGPELQNPLECEADNGHTSDWCHCKGAAGAPGAAGAAGGAGTLDCTTDPAHPPKQMNLDKDDAVYTQRHNWVVSCSAHAYTAHSDEHEACDSQYAPDGSRKGKATFTFAAVPAGAYDVLIESKHSVNRNTDGALFYVNGSPKIINQRTGSGYIWDLHGRYCLGGTVQVILDSTVNGGSDAVSRVRLSPAN